MKKKKIEHEQILCICGNMAKGITIFNHYYFVKCEKCKKKYKYKNKKLYQEDAYKTLTPGKTKPVQLMVMCNVCKELMYHNYKYQFCMKCRTVKYIYK